MSKFKLIYSGIFLFVSFALVYIYFSIQSTSKQIDINLEQLYIQEAKEHGANLDREIKEFIHKDFYTELKENPEIITILQSILSSHITSAYQYIYILRRDKKGTYRYLIDGSHEDRGEFNQRLNVDKKIWDGVYNSDREKLFKHNESLDTLWVTYLYPVSIDDRVQAVIAMDFSTTLPHVIKKTIEPLSNIFLAIFIAIAILISILFYQTLLTIKSKRESITDQLTNVYNRIFLRDFLEKFNPTHYAVLMVDIDHFKIINDTYGHKIGDIVLKQVVQRINQQVRKSDIVVRYGGEEFLIFIKRDNKSTKSASLKLAKRINTQIDKQPFEIEDIKLHVTVSIGINRFPEHFKTISDAIKYADEMLYIAKRSGRNKIIYESTQNMKDAHLDIEDIKDAIDDERLFCQFQPIIDVKTKKIDKYEALVRLKNKEGETIYPNRFLDVIFNTNLYNDMTKQVIHQVFKTIEQESISMSVNVNFSDILNDSIYHIIIDEIQSNNKIASALTIELLEYELLENITIIKERLEYIKSFGVKIALDDFGSGYANYMIFEKLPIDIIKIDGAFIKEIDTNPTSKKIVTSIQVLAQELGLETVAEFVHSQDVQDVVTELGITYGQGFHLGKPSVNIIK